MITLYRATRTFVSNSTAALVFSLTLSACGGGSVSGGSDKPNTPTNPQATASNQQLTLSWNGDTANTEYHVYCDTDSSKQNNDRSIKQTFTASPGVLSNLVNGATYYCNITAVRNSVESDPVSVSGTPVGSNTTPTTINPPTVVDAYAGNTQIYVKWNVATNATGYNVYYSMTSPVTKAVTTKVHTDNTYVAISNLSNGMKYYVVVTAVNATQQESIESASKEVTPSADSVVPPATINVTPGPNKLNIVWNPVAGATSYKIYRSTTSPVSKTSTTATVTTHQTSPATIDQLTNDVKVYFVITSVGPNNVESIESIMKDGTPNASLPNLPSAPSNVTAAFNGKILTFSWQAVSGATGYNVYYATQSGVTPTSGTKLTTTTTTVSSAELSQIQTNQPIYYIVSSYVTSGTATLESTPTSEKSIVYNPTTTVNGSAQRGARLYDDWWLEKKLSKPAGTTNRYMPVWENRARTTANEYYAQASDADTWRCVTCHGSDYQGKDGFYGINNSRMYTGFIGVATTKTAVDVANFIRNGTVNGKSHQFLFPGFLDETDVADLTSFITSVANVQKPNNESVSGGDARAGEKSFFLEGKDSSGNAIASCGSASCHNLMDKIDRIKIITKQDPFSVLHRAQFGHPGGSDAMIAQLSSAQAKDITSYINTILVSNYDSNRFYKRDSHISDVAKGKALYDDWTVGKTNLPAASEINPLWKQIGTTQTPPSIDTWKCKTCHQANLRGSLSSGGYPSILREHYETLHFADERALFDFLRSSSPTHTRLGHAFGYFLTNEELYALTRYIVTERNKIGLAGRLYDSWLKEKPNYTDMAPQSQRPKGINPDWNNFGAASKTIPWEETWSCASCHGWDYKGNEASSEFNNRYIFCSIQQNNCVFNYKTNVRGILRQTTTGWAPRITDRTTLITTLTTNIITISQNPLITLDHSFGKYLSDYEIDSLADFIIDSANGMRDVAALTGNNITGSSTFSQLTPGNCSNCHNNSSTTGQTNTDLVTKAKESKAKVIHKSRFGVPGSVMMPTNDAFTGLTPAQSADVYQYLFAQ